jgi:hypothetical protein
MESKIKKNLISLLEKKGMTDKKRVTALIKRVDSLFPTSVLRSSRIQTKETKNVRRQWEDFETLLKENPSIRSLEIDTGKRIQKFDLKEIREMFNEMVELYRTSEPYYSHPTHDRSVEGFIYFNIKTSKHHVEINKLGPITLIDVPELEFSNAIKELQMIVSFLVDKKYIKVRIASARQKNILTYEIMETAKMLRPIDGVTDNAMNAFIRKHL